MTTENTATRHCPALLVGAMASGQGKTTVTAALARHHRRQGRKVAVFKTGPDYLDPQILAMAAGSPVEPLDLWMAGEAWCRQQLHQAAGWADLILIEGAMGLFDGTPSSGDLAARFDIPVACVLNARGMAQTAAAIALGLARYRDDIRFHGLVTNAVGSERHRQLIADSLPADIALLATLPRRDELALPSRHLGLIQTGESTERDAELDRQLDTAAATLAESPLAELPPAVAFTPGKTDIPERTLAGCRIAIARDAAFTFHYAANLRLLEAMGAKLCFFSPLTDSTLPNGTDAIWLPGGYPELHAAELAANHAMITSLHAAWQRGTPMLAECGGMLYLQEQLTDLDGVTHTMAGLLPGRGEMRTKRGCQGMQSAPLPEGTLRGHAHHHARSHDTLPPIAYGIRSSHPAPGEAIYRHGALTASFLHLFFPSNPTALAQLLMPVHDNAGNIPTGKVSDTTL
ncbi:cobyrinate a,c-diamide synthase [Kushneria phosphatilytica]|uniref:Cobyrinate a,c-diamide synthase n=1 Tax=Kushneria phosphatilytica TaxID=657387 RepID=A0A1S1NYE5_9GAMM|nr:cobyrinate a,c-diamide synthase [Kushneria phosphatilytica]OHV11873.1 cobyrinic acid a,c-diamide synthase [Kushneria phosphatilytica]QEL11046.1 cobyrinate a,c-diamide synthase [Kushneria phosphatilytica]